jgi:hypothetical protein
MSTTMSDIVEYSLSTFGISILVTVNNKIVVLNPTILKNVPLEDLAESLSSSPLTDDEVITAMETIDHARRNKIPSPQETSKKKT